MGRYRIICFEGGGVRGVYSARILERLELRVPGLLAQVHLLAGTSTGGIIALGLAAGLTPRELVELYVNRSAEIFDDSWWDDVRDMGKLAGADYRNKNLRAVLKEVFGTKLLRDLSPARVLIPSFDLDNSDDQWKKPSDPRQWKAKFFHNFPGDDSDGAESVVDVALRTSAAPTYFPSYQGYIDGGVVANNPAMAAVAQSLDADTGGQKLADLRLLAIGTGENPTYLAGNAQDWGYAQWAKPLINLMIDGVMGVTDYQCRRILGNNYRRVSQALPRPVKLDEVKAIPSLLDAADAVDLDKTVAWLKRTF